MLTHSPGLAGTGSQMMSKLRSWTAMGTKIPLSSVFCNSGCNVCILRRDIQRTGTECVRDIGKSRKLISESAVFKGRVGL